MKEGALQLFFLQQQQQQHLQQQQQQMHTIHPGKDKIAIQKNITNTASCHHEQENANQRTGNMRFNPDQVHTVSVVGIVYDHLCPVPVQPCDGCRGCAQGLSRASAAR